VSNASSQIVQKLWSYCNVLARGDLDELVACYEPGALQKRKALWSETKESLPEPDVIAVEA
jgi:hypothetical protein